MSKKDEGEFNIFNHELVPKHILLSKEEAREVLDRYKIMPYQLPKIKESDPVARALNAKHGDILKILREGGPAGAAVYYRYVIKER
ncbi:DNA-directed RNA polymerase subunit H [Candidatus Hecatella orcuttiae]|jgi:DNA-directed RNA polymerase subunit H (RpoH/RPB5)|uniref:DNA-directed RNA polymerase subunit H n=1 Tax=Candidatus Hecatella orcuttiae TaxID=1935119 RepID=UPI002867FA70|nr:DNA-directed RNA polymerase subunit H [Candidatus Hecatella orcuttiae]